MSTATITQPDPGPAAVAPRKSRKRLYIILGGVVVVAGLVSLAVYKSRHQQKPIMVTFDKAQIRTITHLVTATGKVQPEVEVKISPEVAGEIIALPFKEGAQVKRGDVVCQIKPDYYKAQVDQQEAALVGVRALAVQNKAQLFKAKDDLKRSDDLYAKKLISDSDYTVAKTAVEVAQANYDNALAQIRSTEGFLSQAKDLLSKTTVYAPMDGTISALETEVGERVVATGQFAGTEVMRIADLSHMEVRVKVNENDIINVTKGDHAVVSVDAIPSHKFDGTVREISSSALTTGASGSGSDSLAASASDEVTNFLVRIRITDPQSELRPGMSATVDIETQTDRNVVAVPIQSVTVRAEGGKTSEQIQEERARESKERSGNDLSVAAEREQARRERDEFHRVVFVRHGNKVALVPVETGIADNTYIEIKKGIKAGEEVVSGSYAAISRLLKDGSLVMPEKPAGADNK